MIRLDSTIDGSVSPLTRHLTAAQQDRLADALEAYMKGMEQGQLPSVEALVGDDRELLEPLRSYIDGLNDLHQIAVGFPSSDKLGEVEEEELEDDRRLGDFRLQEIVGRGGMGVVYRAEQLSLRRTVAIKLLPMASVLDARQVERFRNEAQAAASLQHDHIVPVYAVGCERGVHYYAMQFIEGTSMDAHIETQRESEHLPDWRSVVELTIQAAGALQAAHDHGVIHRDVKPSNLMLDQDAKLWVTDFGLARYRTDVSLTQSGDVVGTMRYMSPEQACGESTLVDGRTDVYSLGVTLYEMLCLKPAHDAEDALGVLRCIDREAIVPIRSHRSDLPRDLETVIGKAISGKRESRYESAAAMADDLRRVLEGLPTIARPPSTLDRMAGFVSRHQRAVALTLVLSFLGLFGLALSTAMIAAEKQKSDNHAERAEYFELESRQAYDRLGSKMAELLADVPGAESVRRRLLAETLDYYENYAASADQDPQHQEQLALTYGKIGVLHGELGDHGKAVAALRNSERIYSHLAAVATGDPAILFARTISQNNLARALQQNGELAEAATWFSRAIDGQETLITQSDASQAAYQEELAATLNNLALLLAEVGAAERSETTYRRAIKLLESLPAGDPMQLASMHANLSALLKDREPKRAILHAERALARQSEALREKPGDVKLATDVVVSLTHLGTSQAKANDHQAAIQTLEQAIDISRQLHQQWPSQPSYRRDLVIGLNQLGLSLSAIGELENAMRKFSEAAGHQVLLAERYQQNAETQSMAGGVLNNLGFLQEKLGLTTQASESFERAVRFQAAAAELAPEVARYQNYLKRHRHNLSEVGGRS